MKENHREEIMEERGIWKASGRHPKGIQEESGRLPDSRGPGGSRRLQIIKVDATLN